MFEFEQSGQINTWETGVWFPLNFKLSGNSHCVCVRIKQNVPVHLKGIGIINSGLSFRSTLHKYCEAGIPAEIVLLENSIFCQKFRSEFCKYEFSGENCSYFWLVSSSLLLNVTERSSCGKPKTAKFCQISFEITGKKDFRGTGKKASFFPLQK